VHSLLLHTKDGNLLSACKVESMRLWLIIGDVNREVVAQVVVQVVASNFPILAGKAATTNRDNLCDNQCDNHRLTSPNKVDGTHEYSKISRKSLKLQFGEQ
jgi:hypothetical protein